ncbi:DUF1289 domain-containing protein [Noviherbaspirillum cavernae]|uniref:DUF1289 domain-containing protein n=1 Tax=Noviherbaspirillum cavernae TaxID=2320862 RepID=A0A418X537_9BURK|nr:DUF1289 domain-containing protein [Noviherbaspirillum cavernae]RJG07501.1 DUF1289 domain-containing protein [Noviherbaspirillum cavernae]
MTMDVDPSVDTGKVPSPCINVCRMNPRTGLCEGCYRTIDEIAQWGSASEETKRAVWVEIRRRQHDVFAR